METASRFSLAGGYVTEDGLVHRAVELQAVTGRDEEWLTSVPPDTCAARLVTALLTRCLRRLGTWSPVPATLVADLLVGDREYLLVRLREMMFGTRIQAVIRCRHEACGKPLDISFSHADLHREQKPITKRFFTQQLPLKDDGEGHNDDSTEAVEVEFRLPTGADQEALSALVNAEDARAVNQLLARCVRRVGAQTTIDEAVVAHWPASVKGWLSGEIERLGSPAATSFESTCPECGNTFTTAFDFTTFFLSELKRNVRSLEQEVHLLAWHYHWGEQEILALSRQKRQRYVALVQEELERRG